MPVIPVNRVVDPKRIIGKKWRAEEEERHKGSLTQKKLCCDTVRHENYVSSMAAFFVTGSINGAILKFEAKHPVLTSICQRLGNSRSVQIFRTFFQGKFRGKFSPRKCWEKLQFFRGKKF
jgi:hypothetical protein